VGTIDCGASILLPVVNPLLRLRANQLEKCAATTTKTQGRESIAYGDMAAIQIQDPRAQSGRATVARPKQTQTFASSV